MTASNVIFDRMIIQISLLARNGDPEYYLLLAARLLGNELSLGVKGPCPAVINCASTIAPASLCRGFFHDPNQRSFFCRRD